MVLWFPDKQIKLLKLCVYKGEVLPGVFLKSVRGGAMMPRTSEDGLNSVGQAPDCLQLEREKMDHPLCL